MSELYAQNSKINNNVKPHVEREEQLALQNNNNNNNKQDYVRKRKNNNMESSIASKQVRANYYALLDCENDCDKHLLEKFEKHVQESKDKCQTTNTNNVPNQNKILTKQNPVNTADKNELSKKQKIPPINIFDIETNKLIEFLKSCLKIQEFKIKQYKHKKSLFLDTINDYIKVRAYLEKTKTKFFTFTPKSLKNKTYLLKGLDVDMNMNEIFDELCKHESDELKFVKISEFNTNSSIEKGYKLPIYMVQISPNSNTNKLKAIKGLQHRCVKWEQLRRPDITQCRNCQGYFHSSANCNLPPKCVKCSNNHEKGQCTLKDVEKKDLFCVICKQHGHPASYRGCEVYKKLQQKLKQKNLC